MSALVSDLITKFQSEVQYAMDRPLHALLRGGRGLRSILENGWQGDRPSVTTGQTLRLLSHRRVELRGSGVVRVRQLVGMSQVSATGQRVGEGMMMSRRCRRLGHRVDRMRLRGKSSVQQPRRSSGGGGRTSGESRWGRLGRRGRRERRRRGRRCVGRRRISGGGRCGCR